MNTFKGFDRMTTIVFLGIVAFIGPFHLLLFAKNSVYLEHYPAFGASVLITTMAIGLGLTIAGTYLLKKPQHWVQFAYVSKIIGIFGFFVNITVMFFIFGHVDGIQKYEFPDVFPIFSMMTLWLITRNTNNFIEGE